MCIQACSYADGECNSFINFLNIKIFEIPHLKSLTFQKKISMKARYGYR